MNIHLFHNGLQSGPHSEAEVRALLASGMLYSQDLAWKKGLPSWVPLNQVITLPALPTSPAELPPVPPPNGVQELRQILQSSFSRPGFSAIQTVSGIIALILGVLAAINIAGCVHSQHKLDTFEKGSDESSGAQMILDTIQGINQNDPLRGIQGLFDRHQALKDDADNFQLGAWVFLIGASVAGGVFTLSKLKIIPC